MPGQLILTASKNYVYSPRFSYDGGTTCGAPSYALLLPLNTEARTVATAFSEQDIELLGYVSPQRVEASTSDPWVVFRATATAGLETIDTAFLYLKSDCTMENAQRATDAIRADRRAYVVVPKSLRISIDRLRSVFGKQTPVYIHEDLLWDKIHNIFADYIASLQQGIVTERYYVPPRSTDDKIGDKLADVVQDYLISKSPSEDGTLFVLAAFAGVGKTTLSRYLVKRLAASVLKSRTIPVYVEASHWGRLHLESVDELWEIIDNSLRAFSHTLRIRQDLFEHALKQGYIAFIFDGFDELCGHKSSHFAPSAVLQGLAEIAKQSSARIVLTTRTLYWDSEIEDPPENVRKEEINYFNTQQAKGYFNKFFHDDKAMLRTALGQYSTLVSGSFRPKETGGARNQFVNLPLCVAMVAEHVRQGGTQIAAQGTRQLLENILEQICDREVSRKNLLTKAVHQLAAFQELALSEQGTNPEFQLQLLEAAGISSSDMGKMVDHPLLNVTHDGNYRFSYDFLAPYLRALHIADAISSRGVEPNSGIWPLLREEANGKGFMLEHLESLLEPDAVTAVGGLVSLVPTKYRESQSFLLHLALDLIRSDANVVTGAERTERLFAAVFGDSFFVARSVSGLYLTGPFEGLDLSSVRFSGCRFQDATLRNCRADSDTRFERCVFTGEFELQPEACKKDGWGAVKMLDCEIAFPASLVWDGVIESDVASQSDLVKDTLRLGLGKFWCNGRLKTSLRRADWTKGLLGRSGYCKPLLDAMLKSGLVEEVHISGVPEGGLAFRKESLFDLQKFMDNQQMIGKVLETYTLMLRDV